MLHCRVKIPYLLTRTSSSKEGLARRLQTASPATKKRRLEGGRDRNTDLLVLVSIFDIVHLPSSIFRRLSCVPRLSSIPTSQYERTGGHGQTAGGWGLRLRLGQLRKSLEPEVPKGSKAAAYRRRGTPPRVSCCGHREPLVSHPSSSYSPFRISASYSACGISDPTRR
jgi:hypothetical protein